MPWTVVRRLGRGAMGVVELAVDPDGGHVARKRVALHGSARELDEARHRIRREGEMLTRLQHPAIVPLLAVEEEGDDLVLVMPYLPGGTLADRVATGGPLDADEVERLGRRLLDALAAAHRAGIVHRDVKPANVLFDGDGEAHLADFGVARSHEATAGLTRGGVVVGTPAFMAPEQARGDTVGPAGDVFALGATLLFALTGRSPWGTGGAGVLLRRAARGRLVTPVPRDVPARLRRTLRAMLARDPARRPSAAALLGGPASTGRATVAVRASRRRVVIPAAVGAVVAAGAVGVLATARDGRSTPAPATASCRPLPYQPCGAPPAPFTDGRACVEQHADYDRNRANGCEAAPDTVDGTPFTRSIEANLVPAGDVDEYPFHVGDGFQLLCDGKVKVTITAPAGVAQRVEILDEHRRVLAVAVSGDAIPATATAGDPNCLFDDAQTLTARVSTVSGNSAASYRLTRAGSF